MKKNSAGRTVSEHFLNDNDPKYVRIVIETKLIETKQLISLTD